MKLKQIGITYFRCFESLSIPLQPDVNVFVGVNGAGKTAILDAMAMVLWDVVAANGGGGKRERSAQNVSLRLSDINIPPNSTDSFGLAERRDFVQVRARADNYYRVPNSTPDLEWQEHISFKPPAGFSYDNRNSERLSAIYRYFDDIWQEIRKSGPKALISIPLVAYYRANRRLNSLPDLGQVFNIKIERHEAFRNALNAGANYDAMLLWFYQRENQELRERLQVRQDLAFQLPELEAVRSAIFKVIDDVENIAFGGSPPTLKIALKGKTALDLEQMSDGYRNLLALVMDFARRLAQANPGWDNPLDAPGILLIDEIELHLHPRWQQQVIPKLQEAFPNTQLIVTTHSPQVVTTVESAGILIVENGQVRQCPAPTFGARSSDVISEVLGVPSLRPLSSELGEILPDKAMCGLAGISPAEVEALIVTCGLRAGRLNRARLAVLRGWKIVLPTEIPSNNWPKSRFPRLIAFLLSLQPFAGCWGKMPKLICNPFILRVEANP